MVQILQLELTPSPTTPASIPALTSTPSKRARKEQEGSSPQRSLKRAKPSSSGGAKTEETLGGRSLISRMSSVERVNPTTMIPRIALPSLPSFLKDYMVCQRPVIITGAMQGWPAMGGGRFADRCWSNMAYLKRVAGLRTGT